MTCTNIQHNHAFKTALTWPGLIELWDVLPEARMVGGVVRDILCGKEPEDIDLASPLSPEMVTERLSKANIKVIPTGLGHGTITAISQEVGYEITTLRRDVETDGRHAVIEMTDDWEEDALRRDFTFNALSLGRDGTLFDYFHGQEDLATGMVRFVGEAEKRITEDYLRILRFFRFYARFGQENPDPSAVEAIIKLRHNISNLSAERIWSELKRILSVATPTQAITLMVNTGVLRVFMPALMADGDDIVAAGRLIGLIKSGAPIDPLLRATALFGVHTAEMATALKMSTYEANQMIAYQKSTDLHEYSSDDDVRRALAADSAHTLIGRTWLKQRLIDNLNGVRQKIIEIPQPIFPVQGQDLVDMGMSQGPRLGVILKDLRQFWLESGCLASKDDCLKRLPDMGMPFFAPMR